MIRMNLAVLSIVATMAWIITGLVHAAAPLTTPAVGANTNNSPALWHGIDSSRRKPVSSLNKRTPKRKPERISWPEGATQANLLIKFNDELKVRLDANQNAYSLTGHDLESFNVVLEGLELSLQPVYNVDPTILESIINRAELFSGEAQPDLAGTYYVVGTPADMDAAGMVLLKDPRVEWAQFTGVQEDPRDAVAQRKQDLIDRTVASIQGDQNKSDWTSNTFEKPYETPAIPEITMHPPVETRGLVPGAGACCVTEDDVLTEPMLGPNSFPGPNNPIVTKVCVSGQYNATTCLDLDGKFGGPGTTCENAFLEEPPLSGNWIANPRFYSCNDNAPFEGEPNAPTTWPAVGACCTAGDCDVLPLADCIIEGGIWLDGLISRFDHEYHPITDGLTPTYNPNVNIQLLGSLYGLTNFINYGPAGLDPATSNTNYTYYAGNAELFPAPNAFPITVRSLTGNYQYLSEFTVSNYSDADQQPGNIRRGLVDFNVDTLQPAWGNGLTDPFTGAFLATSGGFTYYDNANTSGVFYNPNYYIGCIDVSCQFGVCALPCWDATCTVTEASSVGTLASSPIYTGAQLATVPENNVTCGNLIYEQACDGMINRSSVTGFNPTGSAWQDLYTGLPRVPQAIGCQTENDSDDDLKSWFIEYFDAANGIICPPSPVSTITFYEPPEAEADILYGTCFYGHQTYPTMTINPVGNLQVIGIGNCYGSAHGCPTWCNSQDLADQVCGFAPSCCDIDDVICPDDGYGGYRGWSFICADLANQFSPTADALSVYYTDFNQQLKVGGPYPEYNALGITPVVQRDLNGQPIINPATGLPTVIPAPTKCQINYGVQNQCLTAYFSEFQPSLSDRTFEINGGENGRDTRGGCADFECCHRVCSIIEPDPATGFNYASCCESDPGWVQPCVDKAMEICYYEQNGVYYNNTPDFTPLQFNLSQKVGRGIAQIPIPLRRLVTAPLLAPSIISPIPGNPTIEPDNWVQSVHQLAWTANPYLEAGPDPTIIANQTSVAALTVTGQGNRRDSRGVSKQLPLQFDTLTGTIQPAIPSDPVNWDQFYYGNPPVLPIAWYGSQGLSLYGNTVGQPWPTDPSFLSPSFGLYSWGQHMADMNPGYHPWGPHYNGTRGAGVRIAVLDTAAWLQEYVDSSGFLQGAVHEDLGNVILEGPALGYPEVDMLFDPFVTQPQRGTAVLGAIGAGANGFGVTGIATEAQLMFFPTVSASTGVREIDAWVHAIESLGYGDILIATYPGFNSTECLLQPQAGPGEEIRNLISLATANGITVVLPAGDTGSALDDTLGELEDTGACIIAASMPANTPHRYWSSNYSINPNTTFNGLLPITSGSAPITTTGGDCNLTMTAINTADDSPLGDPSGYISRDTAARSYTNNFGGIFDGSKAAAAQAAAVAACLQGFSLQRYGIPQSPGNLRDLLWKSTRDRTEEPNSDGDNGGGSNQNPVFGGSGYDFDLAAPAPEEGAPEVGGYMDPANAGVYMVIDPQFALDSSEYLYDFRFIRGIQQFGMIFSLEEADQQYLIANSEPTARGSYTPDFEVPGAPIKYLSTGDYTDLYIQGVDPDDRGYTGNRSIVIDAIWPPASITEVYMYSYTADRWMLCPSVYVNAEGSTQAEVEFDVNFPEQFFGSDGYWHARIVTHTGANGPGSDQPGGGVAGFIIKYDLFDFRPSGPQGGQDGAGG
ncbi:MAG: hypothetical protein MK089_08615 [Phycisphaerales bacterium]|nr:hypothetical protein [Phycisphaerales bacterium]